MQVQTKKDIVELWKNIYMMSKESEVSKIKNPE